MNCFDATRELVQAVPEAEFGYRQLKARYGSEEPGVTVVFEDVLKPLLVSLARSGGKAALNRAFGFVERLANDPDSQARDLVAYAVDDLCLDQDAWRKARPFMGRRTGRICQQVSRDEYKFSVGFHPAL
jgi:hypothetical protein